MIPLPFFPRPWRDFPPGNPRAFTLIELLVVISIVGVLSAIIVPVYSSIKRTSDRAACLSNLKQIVAATNLAAADNNNVYPNMHGYSWETGDLWIADALAPYVAGYVGKDPTKLLRCPAAQKNSQEAWLQGTQFSHYRFNYYNAGGQKPLYGLVNALLFFDTTYPDWTTNQFAHFPGNAACIDAGYADGHVAVVPYTDYKKMNPGISDDGTHDFYALGWKRDQPNNP